MGDASDAGIALRFLVAGGRVGVEGKAVYEVSLGVGDDVGTVTVVAELLKKLKTDNCLCIQMVLVNSDWNLELMYNDYGITPSFR